MKYLSALIIVLGLWTTALCATFPQVKPLVIGGEELDDSDLLAKSAILVNGSGYCTGVVIEGDVVLTAAHCMLGYVSGVRAHAFDPKIHIKNQLIHPAYKATATEAVNDIGVLLLEKNVPEIKAPATVLPLTYDVKPNDSATVVGYGVPFEHGPNQYKLNAVDVAILNRAYTPTLALIDQSHGKGACNGDSGGPAFIKINDQFFLWAIVSGPAQGSTTCSEQGVYTLIRPYQDWIMETIAKLRNS